MKNILIVGLGYYGRGSSLREAYDNVRKAGALPGCRCVLLVGRTELRFVNALMIEGEVTFTITFQKLSALKDANLAYEIKETTLSTKSLPPRRD